MNGDLLILIGDVVYDDIDMESLGEYGIDTVLFLDKSKVDGMLLGQDAIEYLDRLHEEVHHIMEANHG